MIGRLKHWLGLESEPVHLGTPPLQIRALIEVNLLELNLALLDVTIRGSVHANSGTTATRLRVQTWLRTFKAQPFSGRLDWEDVGVEARSLNRDVKEAIARGPHP